ncbi:MAG: hypothetical protein ACFCUQ_12520 [Kiloniellales bacterium]
MGDGPGSLLARRLAQLYDLPPRELVRRLRRRLRGGAPVIDDLLAEPKNMRAQRPYDFLSRYEAILARTIGWRPLDFAGRRVMELGCGPMLGWGPLALYRGAAAFVAVEPAFVPGVLDDPRVVEGYLLPLHKDLTAIYGPLMDFAVWRAALAGRVELHRCPLLDLPDMVPVDVVLSNSCLEHIFPLAESLRRLAALQAPDCRFLHLVDFGNHHSTRRPFHDIYRLEPEDYWRIHGREINLVRWPAMLEVFAAAGLPARFVPYGVMPELADQAPEAAWCRGLTDDVLWTKTGLVVSAT